MRRRLISMFSVMIKLMFINQARWRSLPCLFELKRNDGNRVALTPAEGRLLIALMGRPVLAHDVATEILWPNPDEQADTWLNVLNVQIHRIRRKMEGSGWMIRNVWGKGWRLERTPD